jgi:RNA polymerase sigma factor (sigma-70 family)
MSNAAVLTEMLVSERQELLRYLVRDIDRASADDIVQSLYLRLRQVPDTPPIANKRGYLFRMASNLAVDHSRDATRRQRLCEAAADILQQQPLAPSAERVATARERIDAVVARLATLPGRTQQVFVLNRYEGLSHPQIAARLGVSTTTVENHMRRAVEQLAVMHDGQ